jgi:hypothetical protein
MNQVPGRAWSAAMKAALGLFAAIAAVICVGSVVLALNKGSIEYASLLRILGSGAGAAFNLTLRRHPQWPYDWF